MNHSRVRLGVYAFAAGFILMVYELAAARILAPSIGSSMYIWTSVIGIIVMALSLGYWYGGKLADARHRVTDIALLFWVMAALIMSTLLLDDSMLDSLARYAVDGRLKAVGASLILFAPTSFVAGMISPYLAKLNVTELKTSGQAIANLGALNSIGGIIGTFLAGFVLFGFFGTREIVVSLAVLSLVISWSIEPHWRTKQRVITTALLVLCALVFLNTPTLVKSLDTPSAHYTLETVKNGSSEQLHLRTGPGASQSGIALGDPNRLVFWYTQEMAAIVAERPTDKVKDILVLGGGAYTMPRYLANEYRGSTIDVVEIDPELIEIAREYFAYDDPSNVVSHPVDARIYVNSTTKQYDVVLVDVFGDDQTPFTFVTREYGDAIRRLTKPDGIVAVNIIGGKTGACKEVRDAGIAPYVHNFDKSTIKYRAEVDGRQNMVAAFGPSSWSTPDGYTPISEIPPLRYTDNFAPTERFSAGCRNSAL